MSGRPAPAGRPTSSGPHGAHDGPRGNRPTGPQCDAVRLAGRPRAAGPAAGGTLPWSPEQPFYDGSAARLAALQRGEPVDIAASDLPPYARSEMTCRWWYRATVRADGTVTFGIDDGSKWLEENRL